MGVPKFAAVIFYLFFKDGKDLLFYCSWKTLWEPFLNNQIVFLKLYWFVNEIRNFKIASFVFKMLYCRESERN